MGVSRGFNARLIIAGDITKESLGTGSDSVPYTKELDQYPITKTSNNSTYADNASFVSIYFNQSAVASGNISGEYAINASLGTVTINESSGGETVEASYSFYRVLGYAKGISFDYNNNLEKIYVIGEKDTKEVSQGNTDITGTIEEFFIDRRAWGVTDESQIDGDMQSLILRVNPNTDGSKEFFLRDTKFGTYGLSYSAEEITGHTIEFQSKNISTA
jgi:hypothetical protein